jgi:pyruvate formate lyase activating enzyme
MAVQCGLCPKECILEPGQSGECRIRVNIDDRLRTVTYGYPCSLHVDPVEKKPLFHFLPGTGILSLATVGCNLHCKNCQNWEISQQNPESSSAYHVPPDQVPQLARQHQCLSVACTYTDPVVYYEYALDTAVATHNDGLKNVMVTAAYINPAPWKELCRHTDAANIDLKSCSDQFYREVCDATLAPVQRALVIARESGVLVEVTNLVIPTLNDRDEDLTTLCRWIVRNLGPETPLHFSRFYPQYRMQHLPPTPAKTLERARAIAQAEGVQYVYIGNLATRDGETTFCPQCHEPLIRRQRYTILENNLRKGRCPACGKEIDGIWN